MLWVYAVERTLMLILLTSAISVTIGTITAIAAWWSNKFWAYYVPLLTLAVPSWLLSFFMADTFGYINPWVGASISLGVCCSVYPHCLVSSSLANRAYKNWEMLSVIRGRGVKTLLMALWPSLRISLVPSFAIIAAECIADFGVSNYYGIDTVTTTAFNIWTSTWSMSHLWWGVFILGVFGLTISRLDVFDLTSIQSDNTNNSHFWWAIFAITPTLLLIGYSVFTSLYWVALGATFVSTDLWIEFFNTLYLTILVITVCIGVVALYLTDTAKQLLERTGMGLYAMPGVVIGATVMCAFGKFIPLIILLSFAVALRYYGLIVSTVAVADKGSQKYFEVISTYTSSKIKMLVMKARLILPATTLGISLIVLDVIRELPISMILQPMNFQTLAMRMSYIARNEAIPDLGPHSLLILGLGAIFCTIIVKVLRDTDKRLKL